MQHLIDSVENSLLNANWYAALTLALTLPDIAGKIETPDISSTQKRYEKWYNKYLLAKYSNHIGSDSNKHIFLSGNDCYALRCSYLHEGSSDILHQRAREVLEDFQFSTPKQGSIIHCNQVNNKLQLQVDIFCHDVLDAIKVWLEEIDNDPQKQVALSKQLQIITFI